MIVSVFKTASLVIPTYSTNIYTILGDIQNGKWLKQIQAVRLETDKNKQKILKENLVNFTPYGTFNTRGSKGLKKQSGLACIDFDHVEDVEELRGKINKDSYVFSSFVSTRGNGLKVLIKIPIVESEEEYRLYYSEIEKHFNQYHLVDTCYKSIQLPCFISYDERLFINDSSILFDKKKELELIYEPSNLGTITNVPISEQDEIANRLLKWFKEKKYNPTERNKSLFKLACAFNDFGVDKLTSFNYLYTFQQNDFTTKEIDNIIKSAYKNSSNFGTKFFEDNSKKKLIKNLVLSNKKDTEIINHFKEYSKENIENEIKLIKNNIDVDKFWKTNSKGQFEVSPFLFKIYLENLNFGKYYPNEKSNNYILIKKENNFLDIVTEFEIKDLILRNLQLKAEIEAFDLVADKLALFSKNYLSMLNTNTDKLLKDSTEFAMIYYQNLALKISKNSIEKLNYEELEYSIWKSQIIDREYKDVDHHESQFRSFIWFASGESQEKYNTLKSVIGYLLHSHKTSANNKAIIFNDETISDNPNGGSGKGIIINAIAKMKKTSVIDGKTFDFNKNFAFQTVNTDTQVLAFDDVRKNFEFERLFSVITEGITIEYKGKDAIKIPVQDSPKIIITTNYTINADGGSFQRRIFEVEMSDYFNVNNTPEMKFGNLLYDDWNEIEWQRFDKFMINCLQYYLENGLVKSNTNNLKLRKFMNETSSDFYEYTLKDKSINHGIRLIKSEATKRFSDEFGYKFPITTKSFMIYVKKYAEYINLKYTEGVSNTGRWFMIGENENNLETEEELPF